MIIAAHADWSVDRRKRWITVGVENGDAWFLEAPQPVGDVSTMLRRLRERAEGKAVILGIDCPIGLPQAYARQLSGFSGFRDFLSRLRPDDPLFAVARSIEDVCLARPFYPAGSISGAGHKLALARKLNLPDTDLLFRRVDRPTESRPAANPLFWTLGPKQCGKAALAAWRELLIPALQMECTRLWPFDGALRELITPGTLAIAETYPAEAMRQIGVKLRGSKQSQSARASLAPRMGVVMEDLRATPSPELQGLIASGFGPSKTGEDPFDSYLGVLGLIRVINGDGPDSAPDPADEWEGWMIGQVA